MTPPQLGHERLELVQLAGQELRVVVGGGEVGHGPGQAKLRRPPRDQLGHPQRVVPVAGAQSAHSRVQLDVDPCRRIRGPRHVLDELLAPGHHIGSSRQGDR